MDFSIGVYGGLTLLLWGGAEFLAKKSISLMGWWRAVLFGQAVGAALALMAFPLLHEAVPSFLELMPLILLFTILNYAGYAFFYKALQIEKVGVVTPVVALNPFLSSVISVVVFNEILHGRHLFGALIAAGAVIALGGTGSLTQLSKRRLALLYCLITVVCFGASLFLVGYLAREVSWYWSAVIARVTTFLAALLHASLIPSIRELPQGGDIKKGLLPVVALGVVDVVGLVAFNIGSAQHSIAVLSLFVALVPVVATFFAWVFLKEQLTRKELVAVVFMFIALLLLRDF